VDDPDHTLPGVITSITPQKKNKERYSIFVNDTFLIGVAESTLLENNLRKGVEITPSFLRKLQRDEGRHAVKSYLLKLLSRREHARRELFNKALKKDYSANIINGVLDELEEKEFINEQRFAEQFARDKSNLNHWGPTKIQAHLRKKGISKEGTQHALDQAFESVDKKALLSTLIKKRRRHFLREEDTFKRKKKVFDYLRRKGYPPGSIYNCLDELMEMLEQ
jgi:regulatory protein